MLGDSNEGKTIQDLTNRMETMGRVATSEVKDKEKSILKQNVDVRVKQLSHFMQIEDLPSNLIRSYREFINEMEAQSIMGSGIFENLRDKDIILILFNDMFIICSKTMKASECQLSHLQSISTGTQIPSKKRVSLPAQGIHMKKPFKYLYHVPLISIEKICPVAKETHKNNEMFFLKAEKTNKENWWLCEPKNGSTADQIFSYISQQIETKYGRIVYVQEPLTLHDIHGNSVGISHQQVKSNCKIADILKSKYEASHQQFKREKRKKSSIGSYIGNFKETDTLREEVDNRIAHFTRFLDIEDLPSQLIHSNRKYFYEMSATFIAGSCDFEKLKEVEVRLVVFTDIIVICTVNEQYRSSIDGLHPMTDTPTRLKKQASMPTLGKCYRKSLKYLHHIKLESLRDVRELGEIPPDLPQVIDFLVLTLAEGLKESVCLIHAKDKLMKDKTLNYIQNYVKMSFNRDVHSLIPYPFNYLTSIFGRLSIENYFKRL